ncbi:MAG: hypothetical protein IRZ10_04455 [Thermoflavifilum sp.]|nr:hypothetical protein [Thermoflavifilum sp.]MCL6513649.1 hypothetical protein [Alicyclobacillus sp.]
MTRVVRRPVTVRTDAHGAPVCIVDGKAVHTVRTVIDHWRELGAWWEGETEFQLWRVETDAGVFDLECAEGAWRVYRVWD